MSRARDHGGGLDAATARFGGSRADWLDLSTGINPVPYPVGDIPPGAWTALPDRAAMDHVLDAARGFWQVPDAAQIIAAPGASALIARIPALRLQEVVHIPGPTYNEHAAAFKSQDWLVTDSPDDAASVQVFVHPNNPDGRLADPSFFQSGGFTIIDESFCDVMPERSFVGKAADPGVLILKSFGKFWGLAGLRLGFAIGHPDSLRQSEQCQRPNDALPKEHESVEIDYPALTNLLGPWPVSGPALAIGARALGDTEWATETRKRLAFDAARLDALMAPHGKLVGGTDLFRLYAVDDAKAWQDRLAKRRIWSRIFPYSKTWLRLGLPAPDRWGQLEAAL